jgi:hypothetical protein
VAGKLGVGAEAVDWSDFAEQLGGGECATARQFEQSRRKRGSLETQLAVELEDRASEAAAAVEQLACDPHLDRLLPAAERSTKPFEPDGAVERAERDLQGRVELVQMPAQPLLDSPSTRSSRWSTSSFSSRNRVSSGRGESNSGSRSAALAIASASIRSDLPRTRPRRSGAVNLGGTRTSRCRSCCNLRSRPRVTCRQSSTAHSLRRPTRFDQATSFSPSLVSKQSS